MTLRRYVLWGALALIASVGAVFAATLPAVAGTTSSRIAAQREAVQAAVRSEAATVLPHLVADGAGYDLDGGVPTLPATAVTLGRLAGDTPLELDLSLVPRQPLAMTRFATEVATPGTPEYRHYITARRFAAEFGASPAAVAAVRQAMQRAGLQVGALSPNRLELKVSGSAAAIAQAFDLSFVRVELPGHRIAFANTSAPRLASAAAHAVSAVIGLNDLNPLEPLATVPLNAHPGALGAAATTTTTATTTTSTTSTTTTVGDLNGVVTTAGPAPTTTTPATAASYANGPTPCAAAKASAGTQPVGILPGGVGPVTLPSTGLPNPSVPNPFFASSATVYNYDSFATAYDLDPLYREGYLGSNPVTGASVPVGIFEWEANYPTDPQTFDDCYGIGTHVNYVEVDGGNGAPGSNDGIETALDIETISAIAPNANITVYQGSDSANTGWLDTFSTIVSQDTDKVVSVSYGACDLDEGLIAGSDPVAELPLFEEAAAQGQTFVVSAGDAGAEGCRLDTNTQIAAVDDPAQDPFVTGVGGTFLSDPGDPDGATPTAPTETVWNGTPEADAAGEDGAGGGGISFDYLMPSYQADAPASLNVINSESQGLDMSAGAICSQSVLDTLEDEPDAAYNCREVPDVSANASPYTGFNILYDGSWLDIGGTSGAAPLWAGIFAVADSIPGCQVGFADPVLYDIAATKRYASDFNDITVGDNDLGYSNGGWYKAMTAYDMASGLGTPNAANLVPDLCGNAKAYSNAAGASAIESSTQTVTTTVTEPGTTTTVTEPGTTSTETVTQPDTTTTETVTSAGTTSTETVTEPGTTTTETTTTPGATETVTTPAGGTPATSQAATSGAWTAGTVKDLRLVVPGGHRIVRAVVRVDGRIVETITGHDLTVAPVRHPAARRFTVRLVLTEADGAVISRTTVYRGSTALRTTTRTVKAARRGSSRRS